MSIFKCKMCGGSLQAAEGSTVAVCEYCGTRQTLPRLADEKRANLYDRAGHFRRNNEFDKAAAIYEKILTEDTTDAEAYWSLVLCRWGIEYVEDPATHRRLPTVNRAQYTSVFDDDNYQSALRYADASQREVYQAEAAAINEIQKSILAISQNEAPFDVFICYKETDQNGRRTPDSVLATELYHQLVQVGYKVFFSRITLEDKLGTAYEPYIFAALNSAKVMVVLGTRAEYFNAVWVKNEWSRYLALIRAGGQKMLIPAYRDMDPYDLPEEFSHLQAQDMSKLGFMQDLIRGIQKLIAVDHPRPGSGTPLPSSEAPASTAALMRRVFLFLEDGDWARADEFCERVLDREPECAEAYLGKMMAEMQVPTREQLGRFPRPFDSLSNYQKAVRFADDALRTELENYLTQIAEAQQEAKYNELLALIQKAENNGSPHRAVDCLNQAIPALQQMSPYRDTDALLERCTVKREDLRKDILYLDGKAAQSNGTNASLLNAIQKFEKIRGWKDADASIDACYRRIEELKAAAVRSAAERASAHRRKQILIIIVLVAFILGIVGAIFLYGNSAKYKYNDATQLYLEGDYAGAWAIFETIADYEDSEDMIHACINHLFREYYGDFATAGERLVFGNYNGLPLRWQVLEQEGSRATLISVDCVDTGDYTCILESGWKTAFLQEAFNEDERRGIGNNLSFLTFSELYTYFPIESDRVAYSGGLGKSISWWLSVENALTTATVDTQGDVVYNVDRSEELGIRPVITIDVSLFLP